MSPFAANLRVCLQQRGMSARQLARLLAGDSATQVQVETTRRKVQRWLSGTTWAPSVEMQDRVAELVGVDPQLLRTPPLSSFTFTLDSLDAVVTRILSVPPERLDPEARALIGQLADAMRHAAEQASAVADLLDERAARRAGQRS